jgi:hypothetical protein
MSRHSFAFASLALATIGAALWISSEVGAWPTARSHRESSDTNVLTCPESAGQQGRGGEVVVGGVEGLVLKATGNLSSLNPIQSAKGARYFVVKDFLAVSAAAAPYATVSIVSPTNASLFYGRSTNSTGPAMIAASRRKIRLPVCGPSFTGFAGGIIVTRPTRVTFEVSSPHMKTRRVTVPIGTR